MDVRTTLQTALQHHQSGQIQKAEILYRRILKQYPTHGEALHFLGIIHHQKGRHQRALDCLMTAVKIMPDNPFFAYNLASVLESLNRYQDAMDWYQKAVALKTDYLEALFRLIVLTYEHRHYRQCLKWCQALLTYQPKAAEAFYYIGCAHNRLHQLDQALTALDQAIKLHPNYYEAIYRKGMVLYRLGRAAEAVACYRQVTQVDPGYAEVWNNMAMAYNDLGDLENTMACYQRARELDPDNPEILNNLGLALRELGRYEEALGCYQRALELKPDYAEIYNNYGLIFHEIGEFGQAHTCYRKALELKPDYTIAHSNLLVNLHFDPKWDSQTIFQEHRKYHHQHEAPIAPCHVFRDRQQENNARRLRVGYVSPDFWDHSCACFMEPLLAAHDPNQVELFCYSDVIRADAYTHRIRKRVPHWRAITGKSHDEVVEIIQQDRIDILVDVCGHYARNRLPVFARKPAPIQVTWLGYPDTTGLDTMDYRLTDTVADPPDQADAFASEVLVRLPTGFLCYQPPPISVKIGPIPFERTGRMTFGSFNNLAKVNPRVVAVWAEILKQVPNSRMLLKSRQLGDDLVRKRIRNQFEMNGIDPHRLILLNRMPSKADHLDAYNQVDIGLDPFPYNGTTSTCEALWMGVPVVTLMGDRHCSRVGASLLNRIGRQPDVTGSIPEYIQRAVHLAGHPDQLRQFRKTARQILRESDLCNARKFAQTMERVYIRMWRIWRDTGARGSVSDFADLASPNPPMVIRTTGSVDKPPQKKDTPENAASPASSSPQLSNQYYREACMAANQGHFEQAMDKFRQAIECNPRNMDARNGLGHLLFSQGLFSEAVQCCQAMLELEPENPRIWNNLGMALSDLGKGEDAARCFKKALAIYPEYESACANLVLELHQMCQWQDLETWHPLLDQFTTTALKQGRKPAEMPFVNIMRHPDPALNLAVARAWSRDMAASISKVLSGGFPPDQSRPTFPRDQKKKTMRVGYVSNDFRNHPVAHLMLGLFRLHDRDRFEVYAYSHGPNDGSHYRQRIQQDCDRFFDIRQMGPMETARLIHSHQVDILVDLMGYTTGSRLAIFAHRPAPIQVTWLGYPGTTGADFMDYIIVDRIVAPEAHTTGFSESLVWMPDCYQINDHQQKIASRSYVPEDFGLPNQGVVFCSFNQAFKIEPVMFDVWMRILRRVPGSVLWLLKKNDTMVANLKHAAGVRGIDPDRLIFSDKLPKDQHLARHQLAHLALDTRIYNGHTTTSDALWAGVPVVALRGSHFASRVAWSILHATGLSELTTAELQDYEDTAVQLAQNPERLTMFRNFLKINKSGLPVFDTPRFVRHLESAYEQMWQIYAQGSEPRAFEVG